MFDLVFRATFDDTCLSALGFALMGPTVGQGRWTVAKEGVRLLRRQRNQGREGAVIMVDYAPPALGPREVMVVHVGADRLGRSVFSDPRDGWAFLRERPRRPVAENAGRGRIAEQVPVAKLRPLERGPLIMGVADIGDPT